MEPEATRVFLTILIEGVIFCLVVIVFLVTIINYRKKSIAAYLDRMKADFSLLERDRNRIALDLHDELNSRLSVARLMLDELQSTNEKMKVPADKMAAIISDIMQVVRHLSGSLVPYAIEREGLLTSLDELIETLFSGSAIQVVSEWKIRDEDICEGNEIHIYRIVQELMSNIIKHAQASLIRISLQKKNRTIQLQVEDNGIGFDQKLVQKSPKGLGLRNILARVNILKGSMYLTTEPGKGAIYLIELPAKQ